jgi:hypothetical protein
VQAAAQLPCRGGPEHAAIALHSLYGQMQHPYNRYHLVSCPPHHPANRQRPDPRSSVGCAGGMNVWQMATGPERFVPTARG